MEEDKKLRVKRRAAMCGAMVVGGLFVMLAEMLFPRNDLISFCAGLIGAALGFNFCSAFPTSVLSVASVFGSRSRDSMALWLERDIRKENSNGSQSDT